MKDFVEWYHKKFITNPNSSQIKIDHKILIELIEKFDIKSILEVGTWEGYTALLFWLHPQIERVKAIDINEEMNILYNHPAHNKTKKEKYGNYFKNTPVELIFIDSKDFRTEEKFDMIFIDANHDFEHVKADTEMALKLNPKLLVWHDIITDPEVNEAIKKLDLKINRKDNVAWMELN